MNRRAVRLTIRIIGGTLLAGALLLTCASVVLPRLTGGAALTVLSGSMTPTIPVGSIAFVESVEPDDVRVGDVITVQPDAAVARYVTHRVVEVRDTDPVSFITKGDANDRTDREPVEAEMIRGKLWFHVPQLGRVRDFIGSPTGLAIVGAAIAAVQALPRLRRTGRAGQGPDAADESHQSLPPGPAADVVRFVERSAQPDDVAFAMMPSAVRVERQAMLLTVAASGSRRADVASMAEVLGGVVVDANHLAVTISLCSEPQLLEDAVALFGAWSPVSVVRSEVLALPKLDPHGPVRIDQVAATRPSAQLALRARDHA